MVADHPYRIKPGQILNPAGRGVGSRVKLGKVFLVALHDDFVEHGVSVIEAVRTGDPSTYLKVVAALLPKQIEVKEGAFDGVSDEELAALVAAARAALDGLEGGEFGDADAEGPQSLN